MLDEQPKIVNAKSISPIFIHEAQVQIQSAST
jgi:hypothetical protein